MKNDNNIPYKTYLEEHEIPRQWYNVRADMPVKPAPLLNPGTGQPLTAEEIAERIPYSKLIILKGLGHMAYEEAKDFNRQVLSFLNS